MHIVYPPVTRIEADVDVLSRKVVRDSIRGISELQLGAGEKPLAYGYDYHSERGHSVCMVFSVVFCIGGLKNPRSRLARRGGINRISGTIYDEARQAMIDRLKAVFLHPPKIEIV